MKLTVKIPLFLVPLIVLPILILGWLAYIEFREASEQRVFGEMNAKLDRLSRIIESELQTALANVELFTRHQLVRKYVLTKDDETRYRLMHGPLLRVFSSYQESFPDYYEIRILLPDGYEDIRRTTYDIKNISEEEGGTELFRDIVRSGHETFTTVRTNPDNGKISLYVSKPIVIVDPAVETIRAAPTLRGYLVLTIDLQDIVSMIESVTVGDSGYMFAADADKNIIIQPDNIDIDVDRIRTFIDTKSLTGTSLQSAHMAISSSYLRWSQPHPDIFFFASLPEADLRKNSEILRLTTFAATLSAIIITTLGMFLLLHYQIIRRVQRLGLVADDIGRGNLQVSSGLDFDDEIGQLAVSFENMADSLRHSNEKVQYLAYHDSLTGLPNRSLFKDYLSHVLARAKRNKEEFALLFLDIDDFKQINDSLGHQVGDELLVKFSERVADCLRDSDFITHDSMLDDSEKTLARLGGDEFTMILLDIQNPLDAGIISERLLMKLTRPFMIDNRPAHIGISIGITIFPIDSEDADELIRLADIAMYHAKEYGKNNYQFYRQSMNDAIQNRLAIEDGLRTSLAKNEFRLYYQPQISIADGSIVGVEALLRWHHPDEGLIPPDVFIPVAESSGLILPIGEWVINEACRQVRAWHDEGITNMTMAVNVSSIQFSRQNVGEIIKQALSRHKLSPNYLEIEITESTIMSDPDKATKELDSIKELGVSIALDDFGTGYSSLSYLHRFPIDVLKIDRYFVNDIQSSDDDIEIISAIIAMAHILNLRVVAEGIETEIQKQMLTSKDCDLLQGYLFSRPLPADEFNKLISAWNPCSALDRVSGLTSG